MSSPFTHFSPEMAYDYLGKFILLLWLLETTPPNSFILICSLITYFWLKIMLPEYPMLYSFPGTHHHVIYYSYDVIPTINMWIPWKYTSLLYPGHLTENGTWQCMNKKYGNSLNTSLQHYLPTRQHSIWRFLLFILKNYKSISSFPYLLLFTFALSPF